MKHSIQFFADIGRAQGITTTASVAIVGALTSTATVTYYHIIYFTLLSIFAHMSLNTYIAKGDTTLDLNTYVPSRNPLLDGRLTKKQAMTFVYLGTSICFLLTFLLIFVLPTITKAILAVLCFLMSYLWLVWYGWKGKRFLLSYDFSFSISYGFWVFFGVFAIGGVPTLYTIVFLAAVVFAATAFAQWENSIKDVDADRLVGVRSIAVVLQVSSKKKLTINHPYFLYGIFLKIGFILCCFFGWWLSSNTFYLLFIIGYGIPSQIFILYRFLKKQNPLDHRKTILLDVPLTGILGFSVIFGKTGLIPIILLIAYLIIGYLVGSAVQSHCEFKFNRFSKSSS